MEEQEPGLICKIVESSVKKGVLFTYCKFNHQRIHDASHHSNKIKGIPRVFEVALQKGKKVFAHNVVNRSEAFATTTLMPSCKKYDQHRAAIVVRNTLKAAIKMCPFMVPNPT